jgi:hypothetical protein
LEEEKERVLVVVQAHFISTVQLSSQKLRTRIMQNHLNVS